MKVKIDKLVKYPCHIVWGVISIDIRIMIIRNRRSINITKLGGKPGNIKVEIY